MRCGGSGRVKCPRCHGSGTTSTAHVRCTQCNGQGTVRCPDCFHGVNKSLPYAEPVKLDMHKAKPSRYMRGSR